MGRAVTASSSPRCSVASDARAWLFLALGSGRRFLGPARNALHTFSAHRFSPAGCRRGVCMHRGNSPFTSHPQACCLTHRSSGQPPARHLARKALTVIIRLAGQAPSRRLPLSSNVGPHQEPRALLSAPCVRSFRACSIRRLLQRHASRSQFHTDASRRRAAPGSQSVKALRAASASFLAPRTSRLRCSPTVVRLPRSGRVSLFASTSVHLAALLCASSFRPSNLGSSRFLGSSWARCT